MKSIRDIIGAPNGKNKGYVHSGRSMGYEKRTCLANVEVGGKEHTRYQPCGERLAMKQDGTLECPKHGEMH